MHFGKALRPLVVMAATGAAVAAPAPGKAPTVAVVAEIAPGEWQFREIGSGTAPLTMCITNADVLVQFQHRNAQCTRFVVDDQARQGTIQYSCPGAGNGRTTIKLSTRKSFRLDTQGIAEGAPFAMSFDVRLMGPCSTATR